MSRHEGVSCDSCLKSNFRGRRYKCLICFDYDLCAACYENGATTNRHTTEHPMQCIITRSDFELYYGGEALPAEQPQAFTCPYCGKMGYTEATLHEHVTSDHSESSFEVVCPICASVPGGDPNHLTDDFSSHLTIDHRGGTRDIDDTPSSRHGARRVSHTGRGVGPRSRRSNMHFSSSSGLTSLSPSTRDSMDPIAELLSQLSGVRRTTAQSGSSAPGQLQQLQMQLQFERQQVLSYAQAARQHIERMPRRQGQTNASSGNNPTGNSSSATAVASIINQPSAVADSTTQPQTNSTHPQCLLSRCTDSSATEPELQIAELDRADKALFVQELLLATLADTVSQVIIVDQENKVTEVKANREDKKKNCVQSRSPRVGMSPPPSLTNNNGSQQKLSLNKRGRGGGGSGGVGGGSTIGLVSVNRSPGGSTINSSRAYYNPVPGAHVRMAVTGTGTVREIPQNMGGNRGALRNPSPGSSRRKMTRPLSEGRNQSSEPSPPH